MPFETALLEALPNPVYVRDSEGRYLVVNAAWERYFGVSRATVLGQPLHAVKYLEGEAAALLQLRDQELWTHGGSQEFETSLDTPKGRRDALYSRSLVPAAEAGETVLVGTILDVTTRKQAEKRRAMEHAVTRVLADAQDSADAITRVIRTICESLEWACGAHWCWDEQAQVLRCAETWHVDAPEVAEFVAGAAQTVNEAPAWTTDVPPKTHTGGLVRRVWMEGAPLWFPDVAQVAGFRRGGIAAKAGLHCAFGFPITAGGQPLGVIEFYGREIAEPDEALLAVVQAMGSQIAQFIKRRDSELRSERFEAASLHKSQFLANMSH
ncbi:MAG TPA: PAS domain-containing protein, partial [Ramlibacter sp.]|nr:PAS domain-containing protein [Ramlibacter sp.]